MKHKVVIADDSTSIQKFAKITLASEGFEVVSCLKSDELMSVIQKFNPAIILLDFNLSDSKTGYDLSSEIQSISNAKTILLYGTFDTIDETLFADAGVSGHLVKPFDENKLLNLCRQQISDSALEEEIEIPTEDLEEYTDEEYIDEIPSEEENTEQSESYDISIDDDWVVNQPEVQASEEEYEEALVSKAELNSLEAGMQDWGIDVPSIIGKEEKSIELPPVIGGDSSAPVKMSLDLNLIELESETIKEPVFNEPDIIEETVENSGVSFEETEIPAEIDESVGESTDILNLEELKSQGEDQVVETEAIPDEIKVPEDSDLEYPDIDQVKKEIELELSDEVSDTLELSNDIETSNDISEEGIGLDDTLGTNTDEEVELLKQQIADETGDDVSWETDEVITEEKASMEDSLAKAKEFFTKDTKPAPEKIVQTETRIEVKAPSEEDVKAQVERMLVPMVEKLVNEKIEKIIEKVSWEIIPDLAENLIKKELQKVTKDVLENE